MTGPEHLREGKRLLVEARKVGEATQAGRALGAVAGAHIAAAQVGAFVAANLPDYISWQEASEA
ncbi:MAG TPA: hypothetical protein VK599_05820 [Streptosporangiaceae bacterium]|nr:hypothetical protein [Streptosporangiaceae bacterium]